MYAQIVLFDGCDPLDVIAPYEVLYAGGTASAGAVSVELVSAEGPCEVVVSGTGGLALRATAALDPGRAGLILVPGASGRVGELGEVPDHEAGVGQRHEGVAHPEHWPHGVYLTWDQYDGWRLIEAGGSRNIDELSPDSRVYRDPRQVAADVQARFTHGLGGWTPGPIYIDGDRWPTQATQAAVERWATSSA
ncbi:hypothetical protein ABTY53_32835 [Streptomyces noursei]|uniref:hypothetical protein n=1 Tax=Streptomyces noursei TaxID=1971 RepID=UPI0033345660